MRVLIATRPFHGHLHPMLPVATALRQRGHDVRVATHPDLAGAVAAAGLRLTAAGGNPRRRDPAQDENPAHPGWNAQDADTKARDLLERHPDWPPDVVIREQTDFGALLYGELVDVPVAALGPAMYIPPASWIRLFGERMDPLRTGLGLPVDPGFERITPWLYLDPAPTAYQVPSGVRLAVRHETRPVPVGHGTAGPAWLRELPRRSTVYLTFGTVYNHRPRMLRAAAEGLLDAGFHVVLTVGPGADPESLDLPADERLHAVGYLPQGAILPHCAAVVSHGGFGSVMGALWQGLPQVVVPLGSDNPMHATRVQALGVGVRLWARDLTADSLAGAVRSILGEKRMVETARIVGRRVRAMPAPDRGAELVERLVADRVPARRVPARARRRPRTAVAIPVLGRPELTRALLDDVAREPWVDPVVVDNGGDHVPVHGERVLRPGRNLGWAGACNLALTELTGLGYDAVVLLNNDTRLSSGFFAGLWSARHRTGAALVGPSYDGTWPHQRVDHDGSAADYRRHRRSREVAFLDGTCLFVPRETVADVGLLDLEAFPVHGWGADLDYALRVRARDGRVVVTEESFLHHDGGGTASVDGETWKVPAWQELVSGMRRRYGVAWPRLLRDPDTTQAVDQPGSALSPAVIVVGTSGSGGRFVHRALNLLGLPPAPDPDQRRIDRLADELGLAAAVGEAPESPDEVLGAPQLAAALDEVRRAVGPGLLDRPTLWNDPSGGGLVPFWAAAYGANPVCVLVVRNPLDVVDELRAESGHDLTTALAAWERRTRLALRSLVGLPVLVIRLEDLLLVPLAWSREVHRSLTGVGVPLLGDVHDREVAAAVAGGLRAARHGDDRPTTPEQESLYALLLSLVGGHTVFPDVTLPAESPGTVELLARTRRSTGPPLDLGPDWTAWVTENRAAGVDDRQLLAVLVQRGIAPTDGGRALARIGRNGHAPSNGRVNGANGPASDRANGSGTPAPPAYRTANRQAWDLLSGTSEDFGLPVTSADLVDARAELEGPVPLPWDEVGNVLCLAGAGGRQGPLFAGLGLDVVVADLSTEQLALDRSAADRLGLTLETVVADMTDLSPFADEQFDLVHQPVSLCYVPDPAAVFAEVSRVLAPGGRYWVETWNPVQIQLDHLGRQGPPYRLVRPQGTGRPVRFGTAAEELETAGPECAWHYVHPVATMLGSLCAAGFEIVDLQERRHGDPHAAPGTDEHLEAFAPPFFTVLAQKARPSDGGGS